MSAAASEVVVSSDENEVRILFSIFTKEKLYNQKKLCYLTKWFQFRIIK